MNEGGKKVWYFADGYLPEKNPASGMEAHEALMLFNPSPEKVKVCIDVYYSDRDSVKGIPVELPAERIISLRMDHPEDLAGTVIPVRTQYALRITASHPIVVQFGRLDTTQSPMAYYVGIGYAE